MKSGLLLSVSFLVLRFVFKQGFSIWSSVVYCIAAAWILTVDLVQRHCHSLMGEAVSRPEWVTIVGVNARLREALRNLRGLSFMRRAKAVL